VLLMSAQATPKFRRMAQMISQDLVVVPLVESYMQAAKFPKVFDVTFRDEGTERRPDGFFHPSTHPLMGERQLYYYLTADPDDLIPEDIAYENRMAMIMGTAVHSFIQTCLIDAGLLLRPVGTCIACGLQHGNRKNECDEYGAMDKVLGRRGHMDGILQVSLNDWGRGLFEFKTINPRASFGLEHHALDWLKTKKPEYYAQVQDYLDMTGMQKAIILFCVLGFPWKLVEIEVPYDYRFVADLKARYGRVREAERTGDLPDACCAIKSKESKACFARNVCPVGRMR
jgi:hypothetical protein